jgi:exodeoxyribonuclease VII large subunit
VQASPPQPSRSSAGSRDQGAGSPATPLPGPFPVGSYAYALRDRLRKFERVALEGEVFGLRRGRARAYFELRDSRGALPCSIWLQTLDASAPGTALADGTRVVVGGGCEFYPGSATASPAFAFSVSELRIAGEGDLLVALERLRRTLRSEGLHEHQKRLERPLLPRTIGVVTGEGGKARDDILAGLERRGWAGRLVWAFAPVQDRRAAPAITAALRELAALPEVQVVIVARGGGSLADLFAFCDEMLCRTVALLRVPVIASVGHHTDHTLIDDVAALSCSTPTHAAAEAVPLDVRAERARAAAAAASLQRSARRSLLQRARSLSAMARAPAEHLARDRARLHQHTRELRAASRRDLERRAARLRAAADTLERRRAGSAGSGAAGRRAELERLALALSAHDPQRTLARGYALVSDRAGAPLGSAAAARAAAELTLSFHDGRLDAEVVDGR